MRRHLILLAAVVIFCRFFASGTEVSDTTGRNLEEVIVTGKKSSPEVIPPQTLSEQELRNLSSNSVADAIRYFSGAQVKDYGGVGGIKTVNIRSMGSHHVGVAYDGVMLGNAQNGQTDLGQFSLDNVEAISLYNGQKTEILQPARDFGTAGTVYIKTRTPVFSPNKPYNVRFTFRTGSFDLVNPLLLAEYRISQSVNVSLNAEWLKSSGRYKFRYRRLTPDGNVAYDTTAYRQNGDINALRGELNFNGSLPFGSWSAKAYTYHSERGIPGAIVNNVWRRGERMWDTNSFGQGRFFGAWGKFTTLANIKFADYRTRYVNNDEKQMKIDNRYHQNELYVSSANSYEIFPFWTASASYDFAWNTLSADMYDFRRPDRFSNYISIATALDLPVVKVQGSLLATLIHDKVKGRKSSNQSAFTPAVYANVFPFRKKAVSFHAFFKQSFRMPTFNDLYYTDAGNASLRPERVTQYDLGVLYEMPARKIVKAVRLSADGYINRVHDKIVAYPKGQQFRWTILNLGKVDIKGVDLAALITVNPVSTLNLTLRAQYTFQRAIDVTSPSDSYYRNQIPYVPRNSGSVVFNADWRGWNLNYSWIYVGERYNQQENIIYNYTQPWYTSDLSLSKEFRIKAVWLRAMLEVNNLFSQDYDVILNYPMPKRNYRLTLTVEL